MVEPHPDRTILRPFRLNGDGTERQGRGETAKAFGVIVILTMLGYGSEPRRLPE
jgi:hypothetical protein